MALSVTEEDEQHGNVGGRRSSPCQCRDEAAMTIPVQCSCCYRRPWPRKVVVSLADESCLELLTWAITVAAQPGDEVIAMHLLRPSEPGSQQQQQQGRGARARVFALVQQCKELCHFRQVTNELRMFPAGENTLMQHASMLGATILVMSSSELSSSRDKFECFRKADDVDFQAPPPSSCSVFVAEERDDDARPEHLLSDNYQVREHSKDGAPHNYSPRGVLQGLNSESESPCSSGSPGEPLLLSKPSSGQCIDESDDEAGDADSQTSCINLNLFKNMGAVRRQTTFPGHSLRARKLLFSFSCSSSQNYRFSSCDDEFTLPPLCGGEKSQWRCFTYEELQASTQSFRPENLIGKGGYAEVYKGVLPDGQLIAVKKLIKGDSEQHKEGGFLRELGIIGHVSHPNATSMIGFCVEGGLHLVFPFSENGSLASVLHGSKSKRLDWSVRYKIAVGTAKGLHYLHKLCPRRIIHRDIKASNILLGGDFEPQISDFGLAKWLPEQWTHHTVTPIEGTFGYLAPEYFMHGIVDEKTDVFAYGVLLLELISGRKPIDDSLQKNIVVWARPHLECCNIQELVDPGLCGVYDIVQVRQLVLVATLCVRQSPLWRPCMNQVLKLLTDDSLGQEIPRNWSTLVCSSSDNSDEYTNNEYNSDLSRHRALAFES